MTQFSRVRTSPIFWIVALLAGAFVMSILIYFTDLQFIQNTLGPGWVIYEVIVGIVLTAIVMGLSAYKLRYFKQSNSTPSTLFGSAGAFLSFCVAGCPSCSITLASYVGLSGVLSIFPYFGSELRLV
jgi:hypothetical protein